TRGPRDWAGAQAPAFQPSEIDARDALTDSDYSGHRKKHLKPAPRRAFFILATRVLQCGAQWINIRAAQPGGVTNEMKTSKASTDSDPGPSLRSVNSYLERNFPDFFAEARFQVGEDDYFLYARFGQYLARAIEKSRAPRDKINRGFTVLNKMARASAKDPGIRQILVSGPLEYIVDAPKARALARKRLSPVAQGYMESLCE